MGKRYIVLVGIAGTRIITGLGDHRSSRGQQFGNRHELEAARPQDGDRQGQRLRRVMAASVRMGDDDRSRSCTADYRLGNRARGAARGGVSGCDIPLHGDQSGIRRDLQALPVAGPKCKPKQRRPLGDGRECRFVPRRALRVLQLCTQRGEGEARRQHFTPQDKKIWRNGWYWVLTTDKSLGEFPIVIFVWNLSNESAIEYEVCGLGVRCKLDIKNVVWASWLKTPQR